uniref:Uncharacterized protein n=1 Tax=Meloidogyne enterolobii TaxID=390850 RepID=A0A6V7W698_MELEN|nr:unnamed protein product [Meloidogyne enterolobii]
MITLNTYFKFSVTQGCGICPSNSKSADCVNCKERYCNEERLVPNHCWINDKEICKTEYDTPCFTERTLSNQIDKGCGKCSSTYTCKECQENRCNSEKEFPYFCKSDDGDKECPEPDCFISKDNNQNSFVYNCGKCPQSSSDLPSNGIQCAKCKNSPFCNTPKFFEEQLFCWESSNTDKMGMVKGSRVCESKCFVSRDSINGQLKFGCGECDDPKLDCKTCTEKYCNEERLVPKHCWINDKEICKTDFDIHCHMERISINETKKGCGNCETKACRKCLSHLCNDWKDTPYYCYSNQGTDGVSECSDPDCYILKLKNKKDNKNEYYQNCGKCPKTRSSLIGTLDELLGERLKENYNDDFQCADCNNGILCNTEKFIEEKLFCLERSLNDSMVVKGLVYAKSNVLYQEII